MSLCTHVCMLICAYMEARVTGVFLSFSTVVTEPGAHSSTLGLASEFWGLLPTMLM